MGASSDTGYQVFLQADSWVRHRCSGSGHHAVVERDLANTLGRTLGPNDVSRLESLCEVFLSEEASEYGESLSHLTRVLMSSVMSSDVPA